MYYIYKMLHLPTGRVYIGQHKAKKGCTDYLNDGYHGSGRIWRNIYNKHSDECVKVILEVVETKEEVNELEIKYISHYKAVWGEYCVNLSRGGKGGSFKRFTDEELAEHRRKYCQRPEAKAMAAEYRRKYNQRPEAKAMAAARQRKYAKRPEVKAKKNERNRKYSQRPEAKAMAAARNRKYRQRPEVKARRAEHQRRYRARRRAELEEKNTP